MRTITALTGIILIVGTCVYLGYEVLRMNLLIDEGAKLSRSTQIFERTIDDKNEILILGDSLAYGVGVDKPEDSFAGVLAERLKFKSIKNNSEIGETTSSLDASLNDKMAARYETTYIIVGGNDIMRMHINIYGSKDALKSLIKRVSKQSDNVYLVTTGDFKNVSLSPWILKNAYSYRSDLIRNTAIDLESKYANFNYIDFKSVKMSREEYQKLEAADGYHLNEQGIKELISVTLDEPDKY